MHSSATSLTILTIGHKAQRLTNSKNIFATCIQTSVPLSYRAGIRTSHKNAQEALKLKHLLKRKTQRSPPFLCLLRLFASIRFSLFLEP